MASVREALRSKPWIGWAVALVLFGISAFLIIRGNRPRGAYSPERLREVVTIRYSDTGDEETMGRGDFERRLRLESSGVIDPGKGLTNPKTQQPTGFLIDAEGWKSTVDRINAERAKLGSTGATRSARPGELTTPVDPKDLTPVKAPDQPK